jgi:UDP-2,4-diacetamido-2,4,6-trideoxy-beta-L-altropyranose hydrolase
VDRLLIRADAAPEIGLGHVMRCLALAQGWQGRGGRALLLGRTQIPGLAERLVAEGVELHTPAGEPGSAADASETVRLAREMGVSHLVVDGYRFSERFHERLGRANATVLTLDDTGASRRYPADLLLNPGCGAGPLYPGLGARPRLLLGPRFVLLRREFLRWRSRERRIPPKAGRLLAAPGRGGDAQRLVGRLANAIQLFEGSTLEAAILGPAPQPGTAACANRQFRDQIAAMPELMAWADLAIAAAGTTSWELAFMGVPAALIAVADNQRAVAAGLAARGAAVDLGWHAELIQSDVARAVARLASDASLRKTMSQRGRDLVDGEGVDRVLMQLTGEPLRLRAMRVADRQRVWGWANDPDARAASFSSLPIPWERHVAWFAERSADGAGPFWLAIDELDEPVGQIRFSLSEKNRAEVHLTVARGRRGRGLGTAIVRLATRRLFATTDVAVVLARVRTENAASLRLFAHAGFGRDGTEVVRGVTAQRLILRREAR